MYYIKKKISKYLDGIFLINIKYRKFILIILDICLNSFVFLLANFLTDNNKSLNGNIFYLLIFSFITYIYSGQYKPLTRYIGSIEVYKLALRNLLIIAISHIFLSIFYLNIPSKEFWILYFIFSSTIISLSRFTLRDILFRLNRFGKKDIKNVVIYGACDQGAKLALAMRNDAEYKVSFFVDESKEMINRDIAGLKIYSPDILHRKRNCINQIIIAIPNLNSKALKKLIKNLSKYKLPILLLNPNYGLTTDLKLYKNLRQIDIKDLLGRDNVSPDLNLMKESIFDKSIFITGAGGSIGGELSKQILNLNPKNLIIIDFSEINLYSINEELLQIKEDNNLDIEINSILGNVCNFKLVKEIFSNNKIDIVFHAAAYKHVPIVEKNPLVGIYNNIFSTYNLCRISKQFNIDKFILISTDKAVRPTNIMGKSKRVAELIIQGFANDKNRESNKTLFSMVRFGNVLASSGSVVPLFKKQIEEGGPVTLTHPEIIRYFMTLEEAAQLLIQSASLAKGGDVFLLDMGDPVKIYDLAKQMINLAGLSVQKKNNQIDNADIKIEFTGLRPGEKLYEELLIDSESRRTQHPLIFTGEESYIPHNELVPKLEILLELINKRDCKKVLQLIEDLIN